MMKKNNTAGVYVHVPFCLKKCLYCDFCSYVGTDASVRERYVGRLCEEIARRAPGLNGQTVDSVYFGGGTPTLLPPEAFDRILRTIRTHCTLASDAEITTECNPATADARTLHALRQAGINRLSVGVQSADDRELAALGRVHRFADARRIVREAREAGFEDLSVDLMYGIPGQTRDSFAHTLEAVLSPPNPPEHLSVYSLIVEPDTPFYDTRDTLLLPDEDAVCDMTEQALTCLRRAGYERYEISNFARRGHTCRHNLHYWNLDDYLGVGIAAHSLLGGVRTGHSRDLSAYLDGADTPEPEEILTPEAAREEYIMLRLRTSRGVDTEEFARRFGGSFAALYGERSERFCALGLMARRGSFVFLTDAGMNVSNTILSELLDLRA